MQQISIIRINEEQANLVFTLFDQYRVFYQQASDIAAAEKYIRQRLEKKESVIFVALDEATRQPVGFTQLYPLYSSVRMQQNWLLNDLYVDQSHRKKGIGEGLISAAMDFARGHHASYVELETAVNNFVAQSLYEQIGFTKLAPETDFITYRIALTHNN